MTAPAAPLNVAATPSHDVDVTPELVRALIAAQHPDLAHLPIRFVEFGWDNAVFRLGDDLALRMPRRAVAAFLLLTEQTWLPQLAPRLPLPVPAPVRIGVAGEGYPYPWSVVPWFDATASDLAPPAASEGEPLAAFLHALHQAAPDDAPSNTFRGSIRLVERADAFESRAAEIERTQGPLPAFARHLWTEAIAAPVDAPRTWFHGDLHGRNVLVKDGRLAAVIDWGDMAVGDAACDLAAVWMLLPDASARAAAIAAYPASEATWMRARGWALLMATMLAAIADNPRMPAMGRAILARLEADS
jgi:aminoglycoside phosphotransferase (APT) family kinase protein